ncbi:MAG: AAA family ATPase [Desulfobacterales bacterium]|nr:AAA family ATPase [Desulfobacterales bacterium]
MERIADYTILENIDETKHSLVYRGQRLQDAETVIIKVMKSENPMPSEIAKFRQEYEIIKSIRIKGVIGVHDILSYDEGCALVLEDFNGISLKNIMDTQSFSNGHTKDFLQTGVKLAETLGNLHKANIVHKDIKPHNILINQSSQEVKLADFGISSTPSLKLDIPDVVSGTLPYMSPEQTGRINRNIDYRTDLYSLGITFYEMLTGQVPFKSDDPMEIIHSHIARTPPNPAEICSGVSEPVSEIVMKLLSKNPEERYQSGFGLAADLQECLTQLEKSGEIGAFELACKDTSIELGVSTKLFGRENEIKELLSAFDRVCEGNCEVMMISGYPGIGKSSLVNKIQKPILEKQAFFVFGKFDQFGGSVPYSSIIEAFQRLIHQLLSENDEKIACWKEKLSDALGVNGKVIADVFPDIELIMGPQPDLPELGPEESQNRFRSTFVNFVKVFASQDHPLVFFADDLQWADPASLHLLKKIITDSEAGYFFLIGAYRDNDMDSALLLSGMLDELKDENIKIGTLSPGPLHAEDVNRLIADMLKCKEEYSLSLAEEVHRKTEGNPLFISRFLKNLYENGLVELDSKGAWQWDVEQIRKMEATDNVLDMMINRIAGMSSITRELLGACACMGNKFDIGTLSAVTGMSADHTIDGLSEAIINGFIGISRDSYVFQHDRIHEAAYATVYDEKKKDMHYKIGKQFLEETDEKDLKDRVIHIVNQFNLGLEGKIQETDCNERTSLAQLNLMAGTKARNSAAYESSNLFFRKGMEYLPENAWENEYELTMDLYSAGGETEYLSGNHQAAEYIFDEALKYAKTPEEKINLYQVKMVIYNISDRNRESLQMGMDALKILNFSMPKKADIVRLMKEVILAKLNMLNKNIEDIANQKELTDPEKLMISRVLMACTKPAYLDDPDYLPVIVFKLLNISLKHGNSKYSPYAYVCYAGAFCSLLDDIPMGEQFGKLGLSLLDKFDTRELRSKVLCIHGMFVSHWFSHIQEGFKYFLEAYKCGVETGDYEFAATSLDYYLLHSFISGENLGELRKKYEKHYETVKQLDQPISTRSFGLFYQMVVNLNGDAKDKLMISGDISDEQEVVSTWLELLQSGGEATDLGLYTVCKQLIMCIYGEFEKAVQYAEESEKYLESLLCLFFIPEFYFCRSIALLAVYKDADRKTRKKYMKKVKAGQKKMKKWADHAPMNHLNKYYLVEAELARISGEADAAMEYYDRSVKSAREHGFLHEEALACELAGKFYLEKGRDEFAGVYMRKARNLYAEWGAEIKVRDMEKEYRELIKPGTKSHHINTSDPSSSNTISETVDLSSLLKASKAMFVETELEKLVEKIIKLALENSGAQKALLILKNEQDNNLYIQGRAEIGGQTRVFESLPVEDSDDIPSAIVNYVSRTRESVILNNASEEGMFVSDPYIVKNSPKSMLCGLIMHKGKMSGILYLENNLTVNAFPSERLSLLRVLSSQAAISIENTMLIKHREQSAIIRKEMEIAANIQTGLIPASPEASGFDIAAYMSPADEVGGDYYDVINGDDRDWVVIGDVSGHGVSAGLVMMMVQTAIRVTVDKNPQISPSGLLTVINRTITENIQKMNENKHMTISVLALYKDGKVEFAGLHEDILVYRSETSEIEKLETDGMWIGLIDDIEDMMTDDEFRMEPGDTMLLYTDGITESIPKGAHEDSGTDLFGDDRLTEILHRAGEQSGKEIRTEILNSLEGYKCVDDVTVVVLKRLPE